MVNRIGQQGEEIAAQYLSAKGYEIVVKNYRTRNGEIDLIVRDDQKLIFVEVKTLRDSEAWPELAVTPRKLATLGRTALYYCMQNHTQLPWSIDVVAITLHFGQSPKIVHYQNIVRDG